MCLSFFSFVRHVSHLFQFLAQTLLIVRRDWSFDIHIIYAVTEQYRIVLNLLCWTNQSDDGTFSRQLSSIEEHSDEAIYGLVFGIALVIVMWYWLLLQTTTSHQYITYNPAIDISAGLAHFSDGRASSGHYILSSTGPYGPPRYMPDNQISNSDGPNDDKSQYVIFAQASAPHLSSVRTVLLLPREARAPRGASRTCQSSTHTDVSV